MKKIINHISRELKDDIVLYNEYLSNSLESKVGLINKVLRYVIKFKGKQFRPLLCILSSKLAGKSNEMTFSITISSFSSGMIILYRDHDSAFPCHD